MRENSGKYGGPMVRAVRARALPRDCAIIIRRGGWKWRRSEFSYCLPPLISQKLCRTPPPPGQPKNIEGPPPPPPSSQYIHTFIQDHTSTLHFLNTHLWLQSYKQSSYYMFTCLTSTSGTNITSVAMFSKAIYSRRKRAGRDTLDMK